MKSDDVLLVFGRRGSGKTFLTKYLIKDTSVSIYVYDGATHEYGDLPNVKVCKDLRSVKENLKEKRVVFQPSADSEEDFLGFLFLVWHRGNTMLVIEEMSNHTTPYNIDPIFSKILRLGRNRKGKDAINKNIGFIGISQRPARINPLIYSQANIMITFRQRFLPDRQRLAAEFGDKSLEDGLRPEKLEAYNFVMLDENDEIKKCPPIGGTLSIK